MSALAQASELLRVIAAEGGEPGESKKAAWQRAYRRLSGDFTFNRIRDLWRQEPRARVSAEEIQKLNAAAAKFSPGAGHELKQLARELDAIAARLDRLGGEGFGDAAGALRGAARRLGDEPS